MRKLILLFISVFFLLHLVDSSLAQEGNATSEVTKVIILGTGTPNPDPQKVWNP